jgi:DNA-binding SARP family transcriptional activator/tetratricopeptide (TPR) repeat protein
MEFCLLGPLTVRCGGVVLAVPRGRQRTVLAALLLRGNRVVAVDELAEALWGTDPPRSARVSVQNHVMRLRRSLGAAGSRLVTAPDGYLIEVGDGELDVARFEALVGEASAAARQDRWVAAADSAAAALALWRGEPLADAGSDLLAAREAPRLAELRLQAAETRIGACLHLGRHGEVIGELRQLAGAEPLRERLHALLMLALYRDGRQGEALAVYRAARDVLVEDLGAEPGPDLQRLHQQILAADPALLLPAAGAGAPAPAGPVPRELPGDVAAFTGRTSELAELDQILLGGQPDHAGDARPTAAVLSAVSGTAGVGKTALAVHWAHHAAEKFPGGQLYVNLRGYDPGRPVSAADALAGFLRSLGVPGPDIPAEETERAARYRSLLAGIQLLVVLDNASTVEQVRPLLPGDPACAVVVTSRDSLAGLVARDGAVRLDLDLLPLTDAVALLRELIGARVDAEPDAAVTLARQCARLPLALRVAAELVAARPNVALASLVTELGGQQERLDLLHAGGDLATSVRAVFSWSYQQLTGELARMFRLLGVHPGPDITAAAAASLAAIAEADARRLLRELARAHLIAEHLPGRYAFHDLLRAYAAEQAHHTDSDTGRDAATGRVLDHYLHTAARAARLLEPIKEPVALAPPGPGAGAAPEQPADPSRALAWFEAEHQVLLAAITLAAESGFDVHACQLPWAMADFLNLRGRWQESAETLRTALAAATHLGDTAAQALSGRLLANTCTNLGDHDQALGRYASSFTLYQRLGNRLGQAKIQYSLSFVAERQGRYADALGHAEQALRLHRAIGDQAGEAEALNAVGWYHGLLGDYQQARTFCRQALTLCAEADYRRHEGHVWDSLGYAEHHLGNLAEAAACYQRALSLLREAGDRFNEADVLTHLGDTRHAGGELAQAREAWQQALAILEDLQHPDAGQVRAKLASQTPHASPNPSA